MASSKPPVAPAPPLAAVRAAYVRLARGVGGAYLINFRLDPEDVATMDAFLNGPMVDHTVVLQLVTLERGWTVPECDPNVTPEEAVADDELARLRAQHVDLLAAMTGRGPESASDASTA